mgnify:CR=1 FL=1
MIRAGGDSQNDKTPARIAVLDLTADPTIARRPLLLFVLPADEDTTRWGIFYDKWFEKYGTDPVRAVDLYKSAQYNARWDEAAAHWRRMDASSELYEDLVVILTEFLYPEARGEK